jgi:DNA polymerase-1
LFDPAFPKASGQIQHIERIRDQTRPAAATFEDLMPETLFIVDMYSLVFQVFHAIPEMTGPSGQPTNAVFGFTRDLQTIRALPGASYLICALDVSGPAVRNEVFAQYKANRSEIPVDLAAQIPRILDVVAGFGIPPSDIPAGRPTT